MLSVEITFNLKIEHLKCGDERNWFVNVGARRGLFEVGITGIRGARGSDVFTVKAG
jgi:hypothetical protein